MRTEKRLPLFERISKEIRKDWGRAKLPLTVFNRVGYPLVTYAVKHGW